MLVVTFGELPVVAHPAATAAMGLLRAVNTLLFREASRHVSVLDSLHGLLAGRCCEGPARATVPLGLHRADSVLFDPVYTIINHFVCKVASFEAL